MLKEKLLKLNVFEDNEYFDKYVNLIESNKNTPKVSSKTSSHHIIPRCYFKYKSLKIDNSSENLVNMFHKDHILSHYFLYMCSKDSYIKKCNSIAVIQMTSEYSLQMNERDFIESLEHYERLRECYISSISGENNPAKRGDVRKKISESHSGRTLTDEHKNKLRYKKTESHKNKLRQSALGRTMLEDTKQKISKALKGRYVGELSASYGKPAWNKGIPCPNYVKERVSKANKGRAPRAGAVLSDETRSKIRESALLRPHRRWFTNGQEEVFLTEEDINKFINNGYKSGRLKRSG